LRVCAACSIPRLNLSSKLRPSRNNIQDTFLTGSVPDTIPCFSGLRHHESGMWVAVVKRQYTGWHLPDYMISQPRTFCHCMLCTLLAVLHLSRQFSSTKKFSHHVFFKFTLLSVICQHSKTCITAATKSPCNSNSVITPAQFSRC